MWAWARYDFELSWEEFEELTPRMFLELCRRRNVGIRYERFANAQTAAAVYNVNRHRVDDPVITAFDFVRDEKASEKRQRVLTAKRFIKTALGTLHIDTSMEKLLEIRLKVIADVLASGHEDAEELVDECFPSLKPVRVNAISGEQSPTLRSGDKRGLR